jgi:hypothetical protein
VYEFPVESKSEFTKDAPLRGYNNRNEDWPKCMHGEDCLVQMCAEGVDGGRRFFKCPRAWVILPTIHFLNIFLFFSATNKIYFFESSAASENCGFVQWVDPAPIHPHQDYIYYLQNRIFDLEMAVSDGNKDEEEDEDSNGASSQEAPCSCHTLKYLILGCECILQCVHLSIEFSENFKDFFGNYSIYPRARSIFFTWKALKFFFMSPKYSFWIPRVLKLASEFPRKFLGFFRI